LFTGTLVAMLVAWPLLSRWMGRRTGAASFAPVFRLIQVSLLAFYAAFHLASGWGQAWAARAFFVWASIAHLMVISIAWGALAGRFTGDQAHRLYGLVAAGGTLGAVVGSALAGLLATHAGPTWLMLLAVGFFEAGLLAARRLFLPSNPADTEAP